MPTIEKEKTRLPSVTLQMSEELAAALERYIEACDARPSRAQVAASALREFLAKRGVM